MYAVTRNEGEIPTTTAGGLRGAYLMTVAGQSFQKCQTVVGAELQEAEICNTFTLLYVLTENGTSPT